MIGFAGAMVLSISATQAQNAAPAATSVGNSSALGEAAGQKAGKADQHFLIEAMQGDMAEINMGKLAQANGSSDGVKQLGKMLGQDHGQHLQQTQQMAQQMGVTAPSEPPAKAHKMHDKLAALTGAKFDKQFAQAMVKDHKKDITKYKKEAKKGGPLADFATQTVPTLEKHLEMAQSLTGAQQPAH